MSKEAAQREGTLTFWDAVTTAPAPVHITTKDGCEVDGTLCAVDGKQQVLQVSGLATALGTYAHTLVRADDVAVADIGPLDPAVVRACFAIKPATKEST